MQDKEQTPHEARQLQPELYDRLYVQIARDIAGRAIEGSMGLRINGSVELVVAEDRNTGKPQEHVVPPGLHGVRKKGGFVTRLVYPIAIDPVKGEYKIAVVEPHTPREVDELTEEVTSEDVPVAV